jgi:hypothetical protein
MERRANVEIPEKRILWITMEAALSALLDKNSDLSHSVRILLFNSPAIASFSDSKLSSFAEG